MRPSGVFTVRDLSFSYDGEKTIFDGLDLSIREGVVTTLIGANGCGKSTLFNLMTKNLQPDSGDIYLRRGNVAQMSLRDFAQLVAIVHQNNIAPDDVTVEKLVEYGRFPFRAHGRSISPEEDEQMVAWALEAAGVSELAGQVASSLSGGQRQRVWIAMALAQGADVLLLDEPTTYLDVRYQIEILNLVHQLNVEYGMTVIMVLHDVNQALYYSDEIIALAHGEVVAQGRPADVVDERLLSEVYDVNLRILDIDGRPFVINVDEREGVCNPANEAFPDYLKTNQEVFMALRGQIETNASGYSASSSGRGLSESEIVGIAAAAATAAANAAVRVASSRSAVEGNGSSDFQKPVVNGDAIGSLASAKDSEPIRLEAGEEGVDPMPKTAPSRSFGEAGRGDAAESNADGSGLKDPTAAVARRSSSLPARPKGRAVPSGDAEQTLDGDGGPADGSSPAKSEVVKSKTGKKRPAVVRGAWAAGGFIAFALGAVGVVLPIIPTTPFMLLAAFCFARSSDKLNNWFKSTKLYHKVLEGYVTKRQMTVKAKLSIIVPVTLLMGFAAFMMRNALVPCIILGIVWAAHIVYFGFIVKTDKGDGSAAEDSDGNSATRKEGKGMPMIKTRLFELLSEAKKYIWYQVLWKLLALAAQIVIVFATAWLLQRAFDAQLDLDSVVRVLAVVIVGALLRAVAVSYESKTAYQASVDVKRILRGKIYEKLLHLGASYRESVATSKVVQLAVEGVEQLETYFSLFISQFFYAFLAPLVLFAVLALTVSWKAALVLLVFVPLIPGSIMMVQKIAKKLLSKYWGQYTNLGDTFLENLQGLTTLKIYRADEQATEAMDRDSESFRVATMNVLKMQLNSTSVMDIGAYGGAAVGMVVALSEFFAGNVTVGGLTCVLLLAAEFFLPMRRLGSYFHVGMNGMAASDNIFELLDMEEPAMGGSMELDGDNVGFDLTDVDFSYDESRQILKDVSMEFPTGSFTSIVGPSGCGKSTVASLIMGRNRSYAGSVKVGGVEVSDVSETSLMDNVTLVTHASYLFKGTVRENLVMGKPYASDEELLAVLAKVNLLDFIDAQEGLDTFVAEGGKNLSGGQCQRLALARALLHDTPAYIFDEATSAVDVESEEIIMRLVRELAQTRTVVLISHRLANVVPSDNIYMMQAGRVVEHGTHDELIAAGGAYAALYGQQMQLEGFARSSIERPSNEGKGAFDER